MCDWSIHSHCLVNIYSLVNFLFFKPQQKCMHPASWLNFSPAASCKLGKTKTQNKFAVYAPCSGAPICIYGFKGVRLSGPLFRPADAALWWRATQFAGLQLRNKTPRELQDVSGTCHLTALRRESQRVCIKIHKISAVNGVSCFTDYLPSTIIEFYSGKR